MKKFIPTVLLSLLFLSCASIADRLVDRGLNAAFSGTLTSNRSSEEAGSYSSEPASGSSVVVDFKADEILATMDGEKSGASYYVAKVLTPASAATKNQAEVVFIHDGSKAWANFVTRSHKAAQSELSIGKDVLFLWYHSEDSNVSADAYRKSTWSIGRITSLDYLYKGQVEINGRLYYLNFLRIPE